MGEQTTRFDHRTGDQSEPRSPGRRCHRADEDVSRLDGVNLIPYVQDNVPPLERTLFWRFLVPARQHRAVRQGDWKLMLDGDHLLLFDLARDPGERNDLSQQRPDLIRSLRGRLAEWEKEVEADAGPRTSGLH